MPDPVTPNKNLFTPAHGSDVNTWDVPLNANANNLDQALGTYTILNTTGLRGAIPLTSSQTTPLGFIVTGTPAGPIEYQTPAGVGGIWLVRNAAAVGGSITLGFSSLSGGSAVNIPARQNLAISADGTANGMANIITGTPTVARGNPTGVANYAVQGLGTAYNTLQVFFDLLPATNGVDLRITLYDSTGTEITTASYGVSTFNFADDGTSLAGGTAGTLVASGALIVSTSLIGNTSPAGGVTGSFTIGGMKSATYKKIISEGTYAVTGFFESVTAQASTTVVTASTISGYKIFFSSGNIASGSVTTLGLS
jgi:hypothetical protein